VVDLYSVFIGKILADLEHESVMHLEQHPTVLVIDVLHRVVHDPLDDVGGTPLNEAVHGLVAVIAELESTVAARPELELPGVLYSVGAELAEGTELPVGPVEAIDQ